MYQFSQIPIERKAPTFFSSMTLVFFLWYRLLGLFLPFILVFSSFFSTWTNRV